MTTFDVPGLSVPARFQMLSALQAVNGVLLFGISTALLFAVRQVQWRLLSHRHETVNDRTQTGQPIRMTERNMADDSSEQVPGQQTDESSVNERNRDRGEDSGSEDTGLGRDAPSS
jgi:hypothetical protein